jgi:hypothetical protein
MVESKAALPGCEVETAVSLHRKSDLPHHSLYFKDFFARLSSQPLFVGKI